MAIWQEFSTKDRTINQKIVFKIRWKTIKISPNNRIVSLDRIIKRGCSLILNINDLPVKLTSMQHSIYATKPSVFFIVHSYNSLS